MTDINGLKNETKLETDRQKIDCNHDEDLQICGFQKSLLRTGLTYVSFILTLGLVRLFFHWYPRLLLHSTHRKCALSKAIKLLIIDNYQGKYKSYFVKDVKIVSIKNLSDSDLNKSFGNNDDTLIKIFQGKSLPLNLENGTQCQVLDYKAFWCKNQCYVWDPKNNEFSRLVGLDKHMLCMDLCKEKNKGLSREEQCLRRIVYGLNEISVPIQSIGLLLVLESLTPFYIFQLFALVLWFCEYYYYYTAAILVMTLCGIASSILQTRKNQTNLHNTVAMTETVHVLRDNGNFENISSAELVPGDIIELPKYGGIIVCDSVLLTGTCIVNESMLTGESVPVTKTPLKPEYKYYDDKECFHHTLYSGTSIIQTRQLGDTPVLARVIRTGLQTKKGALVAAILYPPPIDFKFDRDSYKYIGILTVIAFCGFMYTIISKISRGITASDIALKALDIITIVIPPTLPTILTVGKLYAQARLKREHIYCINNKVISVAGSVNCACFDKTGTLTEDGLDMWGVVPCTNNVLQESEQNIPKLKNHPLFEGMLVCHSLTLIDGKLIGDPLDIKMFESTGWILEEPEVKSINEYDFVAHTIVKPSRKNSFTENMNKVSSIGIVQQFQFSSQLQRMSVIAHVSNCDNFMVYTKGSPEMIINLSKLETIPNNIFSVLQQYTEQGYRVIALGSSKISKQNIQLHKITRELVEKDLEFLGLVVMENRLKARTVSVIKELREANMNIVMITGDNIQTAVSVAKECGILAPDETVIDVNITLDKENLKPKICFTTQWLPLATKNERSKVWTLDGIEKGILKKYKFVLTGKTWQLLRLHYSDILPRICIRGAVFARMTSDQKQQLVLELIRLGYYVVMCGDGANDCGALRAAHVGISLSEAESSVASPFTSRVNDIKCVPTVIREGRAALVTSFGIFKYMVSYSLTEFLSTINLYTIDSNLTDFEFLFIDACLIMNFSLIFGKTEACQDKLHKNPPMTSLLGLSPLFSITTHVIIMAIFQIIAFYCVKHFTWFTPFVMTDTKSYSCYENYSIFCVSMFQYVTTAITYSRGKPYRKPLYTNGIFLSSLILTTFLCVYITVYPAEWLKRLMELMVPPTYDWRFLILLLALINFLVCLFVESFIVEYVIEEVKPKFCRIKSPRKQYLNIEQELKDSPNWPVLSNKSSMLIASSEDSTSKKSINVSKISKNEQKTIYYDNSTFVDDENLSMPYNVTKL